MSTNPFFSVVIPLYNKEDYIKDTLNSVINQTFKDFEIIIINDGSTDNSLKIAKATLLDCINHTIIEQKNQGLSSSRNNGILKSMGNVIALLDADDLWHNTFLETIYKLYNNFPEATIYGTDYQEKYSNKNIIDSKKNLNNKLKNRDFLVNDFFKANLHQSIVCQSSIAFKKSILEQPVFNPSISYAEDVDFYLKYFTKYKLAYAYQTKATILTNVPNQITQLGIKGKTLPNLDYYEKYYSNNKSLKVYLDFKRYMYGILYKLENDKDNFKLVTKHLDLKNLTYKQRFLITSPLFIIKLIRLIKMLFLKLNIRLTTFKN
ncbi:glycosyltransferase family 2 protein [Tamlana fucoidanivorans]|uniref:Glycosyltransferase family 2 protein n=1 Tax=Allotamlana fucoidanivorans TaxID=2583814 RepID=A0A5C4SKA0_9FLAO|nr:glycosyltransferase family 2 protein [Tamlana fucoidanivorans]TNJ43579.1 glycosyltransferase family 2 protein [Tamlana fucoidanivorans]